MKAFLFGALVGWFSSFIYGWNRRSYHEHKEFLRGLALGRKAKR
jgi:hypothetical protein